MRISNIIFIYFTILFVYSSQLIADTGVQISRDYYSGSFLIYNCQDNYWACVDEYSYELCKLRRESDLNSYDNILRCAPIKKYEEKEDCAKVQVLKMEMSESKAFCLHPERF